MSTTIASSEFKGISISPVMHRPEGGKEARYRQFSEDMPDEVRMNESARAMEVFQNSLPSARGELGDIRNAILGVAAGRGMSVAGIDFDGMRARQELVKAAEPANALARQWRDHARWYQTMSPDASMQRRDKIDVRELAKSDPLAKAILDVGTQTNLSQVTGGQSMGYVSLDTKMARATVRPDSFTLYQSLNKSAAFQVVDFWPYIDDTGGPLPGSATSGYSNVSSGTLATSAGIYSLKSVNLKLMLDGRAVTMALMAQNSFVSVTEQENANAALTVLGTADWLCFHGNSNIWPNQFDGLGPTTPTSNIYDYQQFYASNAVLQGWSAAQTLFNMIYEVAAVTTSWGKNGRITHAFMTPVCAGSLQSLVTTLLNNITNWTSGNQRGIVVNGDLQGMITRMGPIQFPMDLMISARDVPAQGQPRSNSTTPTTTTNPTPPTGVVATASGAAYGPSQWGTNSAYTGAATRYYYAVASTDANMNESVLAFSNVLAGSGITGSGAAVVAIAGPAAADSTAFRVFRTGAAATTTVSGSATAYRYVGSIAANGSGTVNFVDANTFIPGSERVYLVDMREEDGAIDYRYLMPLTRIELFAQNLFMPWAVASIGALRNRIPKFNAEIINYVPDNPSWNPLGTNA